MSKRKILLWATVICLATVLLFGTVSAAQTDGWVLHADNTWSYYSDGQMYEDGVYWIGGKYYGFNRTGVMHEDTVFTVRRYDSSLGYTRAYYYRAKAGGALYVNQWYKDNAGNWYYYGADGAAYQDFAIVNGIWYFFDKQGRMVTDELVHSSLYDGYYVISANGMSSTKAPTTGWLQVGSIYYYFSNGERYTSGVYQIGGKYYGFDHNGWMYENTSFDLYDMGKGRWVDYRARKDGSLYVNAWYQSGDSWYYYGAGGVGSEGFVTVSGIEYYFENARMMTDYVAYYGGACYAIDSNGKKITAKGWAQVEGSYVYVQADGTLFEDGWMLDSGKWYYLDPYMVANSLFADGEVLYAVNNAGVCVKVTGTGIYDIGTSGKVYLETGKISTGWKYVGGAWYYFDTRMYANDVYEIDGERYVFDQNGKLFTNGWLMLGHGYWEDWGNYVYADASGKAATGLRTIRGKQYIFSDYGYLYTDTTVELGGTQYVVDEDGVATAVTGNGWKNVDGKYYYLRNGEMVINEVATIDGKLYAFDWDGVMLTNGIYQCYFPGEGYYNAFIGADGVIKTGWQMHGVNWCYADANGKLKSASTVTVNGKDYVFGYDSYLQIGTFLWDNLIVTTDANGAVQSQKKISDGWTYVNGTVYYYKNGEAYTGWVGDYYVEDGRMLIDSVIEDKNGDYYVIDIYGKYVSSGWYERVYSSGYSDFYYAKSGGKLCYNEWKLINGVWYYFDGASMLSDGVYEIDGELCRFDANGKYLGTVSVDADGWKQIGSDWYYIHAGKPVYDVQYIDGKRYVFVWDGALRTGGFYTYECLVGYTDSNGAIPNYTGWKQIGGEWCYFDSSNMPVLSWFQDNDKVYYGELIEKDGKLCATLATGYMSDGTYLHRFASDGAYLGTVGVENGWYSAGGEWYYFKNGNVQTGYQVIDGKGYYLTEDGMLKKDIAHTDGGYAYFDGNGLQRTAKGWYKTSQGWIYVLDDGTLANGVWMLDGKEYYFRYGIMVR